MSRFDSRKFNREINRAGTDVFNFLTGQILQEQQEKKKAAQGREKTALEAAEALLRQHDPESIAAMQRVAQSGGDVAGAFQDIRVSDPEEIQARKDAERFLKVALPQDQIEFAQEMASRAGLPGERIQLSAPSQAIVSQRDARTRSIKTGDIIDLEASERDELLDAARLKAAEALLRNRGLQGDKISSQTSEVNERRDLKLAESKDRRAILGARLEGVDESNRNKRLTGDRISAQISEIEQRMALSRERSDALNRKTNAVIKNIKASIRKKRLEAEEIIKGGKGSSGDFNKDLNSYVKLSNDSMKAYKNLIDGRDPIVPETIVSADGTAMPNPEFLEIKKEMQSIAKNLMVVNNYNRGAPGGPVNQILSLQDRSEAEAFLRERYGDQVKPEHVDKLLNDPSGRARIQQWKQRSQISRQP